MENIRIFQILFDFTRQLSFDQTVKNITVEWSNVCCVWPAFMALHTYTLHFFAKVSCGTSDIASVLVMSLKAHLVSMPFIPSTRCYLIYTGHWVPFIPRSWFFFLSQTQLMLCDWALMSSTGWSVFPLYIIEEPSPCSYPCLQRAIWNFDLPSACLQWLWSLPTIWPVPKACLLIFNLYLA